MSLNLEHELDNVVKATTAFDGWGELCEHMERGYAPTVYGNTRRKRILRLAILASGYSVFRTAGMDTDLNRFQRQRELDIQASVEQKEV